MRNPLVMEKKISLRLDVKLVERLQDFADRERVPVSYVLRHLVIRFLEDHRRGLQTRPAGGVPLGGGCSGGRRAGATELCYGRRARWPLCGLRALPSFPC